MVVVFSSELREENFFTPEILLHDFIIPAAAGPLPDNPGGLERLESLVREAGGKSD